MSKTQALIQKIHDAPHRGVLAVAGAGSQAVAWLLGVAGASRTLLEVVVPYGRLSMIDLVGFEPEQFVSEATALDMAKAAYMRAERLREADFPAVGLGCTATIATDRPKRGEHRAFVATWDHGGWNSYSLRLTKGHRDRRIGSSQQRPRQSTAPIDIRGHRHSDGGSGRKYKPRPASQRLINIGLDIRIAPRLLQSLAPRS